ncbi:ComEC/Rec2 family competence protein [Polaribacter aquimarinus]|uniref:Competence protein n=1 Tax=Polaribacter aquimarinus TaxID=2100726 RepID=A0A2U2JE53_9FLAO|nr:ComEC/Rec2 family competence protein [Polaribacter aquimarinus]PWG06616.1 competence protein [Polaribacter aquimarinus]
MKRLLTYLPLHFVVLLILGICFQFFTQFWVFGFIKLFTLLAFLSLFLFFRSKFLSTAICFLLFFFIGVSSVLINESRNYTDFYEQYLNENSSVVLQIYKVLKPGNFYKKYEAKVVLVDNNRTRGNVLLNILNDSISEPLKVDDRITLKSTFKKLIPPLNPNQFNYKSYLAKQGIYHQIFTKNNFFLKLSSSRSSLFGFSSKLRFKIQKSLKRYYFKDEELAVINALLLGQRQDISKELITNYQNAGAIHILAVSGLHVGVILLILAFVFKPLERVKNGKFLKTFIIILLLWMFAFVAGLSASVVRAVTMFSFVAIGMSFRQKNVVAFSFISSMFFLLLINPMFLFDVGFQLSYLAVLGILWTQPKIYAIYNPKNKIVDFFWKLFTVSIAAQVGILPLSIYYFQQFPGLFLMSNLVIIPFLGAILVGGIVIMGLSLLDVLPQILGDFYGSIISWMNAFVRWVSHQEDFLFKEISISFLMMLFWYIFIFSGIYFLIRKSAKTLLYFFMSIICIQVLFLFEKKKSTTKKEFIVFHKSRFSIIGKRVRGDLYLQDDLDSLIVKNDYAIKSYRIAENIKKIRKTNFKNFIQFADKDILLIDSLGVFHLNNLKKPIVVLQYSPKINLERMIVNIKPSQIIADGSNYKSNVLFWEKTCLKYQIPFHYTGQKGAFVLDEKF